MGTWTEEGARAFLTGKVNMASAARTEFDSKATQTDIASAVEWLGRDIVKTDEWKKLATKALTGHPAFSLLEVIRQHTEDSLKRVIHHTVYPPSSTSPTANLVAICIAQVHAEFVEMFHPEWYGIQGNPVAEPLLTSEHHAIRARAWEEANPEAFAEWKKSKGLS